MRLFVAMLALALLSVTTVSAQAPPSPAPAVSVAFADEAGTITVDNPGTFKVIVRNEGSASGTPLDAQNLADVVVTVTGAPVGWTASVSPATFQLAPQQQQEVELQVSVSADAQDDVADLTVTAVLTTPLEGLEPIFGEVPGASQSATAADTIQIARDDSVTRTILETLGPWIYAILLLLVAAVLVAVGLSVVSRRSLVRLNANARELTLPPGGRVAFPFQVEALGRQADTVLLQVSTVQEGWAAFLPVPELQLAPGEVQDLTLVVIAPKDAADDARQAVLVSATSAKAPKGAANLEFVAKVHGGTPVPAQRRRKE